MEPVSFVACAVLMFVAFVAGGLAVWFVNRDYIMGLEELVLSEDDPRSTKEIADYLLSQL